MLTKHIRKRYTHAIAKVSILSRQNRQQQWPPHQRPHMTKQRSHVVRPHEGGCSGARVEHPFLRKSCFLHRRGAYFQNITFPGPVEKGHRDVVNHMPWRTATRHCVHSVMLSCMTPLCCKQCVSTASTGLARRRRQGRAPPRRIYPFRGAGRGLTFFPNYV